MKLTEKILLFFRMLADSRLRKDIRALRYAAEGYEYLAWELCKNVNISTFLKEGSTIDRITKEGKIKNRKMLEGILDFLVGRNILSYIHGKYTLIKEPRPFVGKNLKYLEKFYTRSVKWTNVLFSKAKETLLTGKFHFDVSFDDKYFLELWDGIMEESPYSFRKMAINKFAKNLKNGSKILDLGCGTGVCLEQILLECKNKEVKLVGVDMSEESLKKAKARLENLYVKTKDSIVKRNIKNTKLLRCNLMKEFPKDEKYDVVFMSLLVHHIPESYREKFFKRVKEIVKNDGKVVIHQIIHKSKFERAPMWVMYTIPTHQEYPFKDEYIRMLSKIFTHVECYLDGMIVVARK